ncbi:serine-rich adhesin for platelets isoform X2 [Hyalella azteca]|uniref:Serine-rich adhesin for platelets isoform X1 n=1 Tax=Hyalella azteca TaxID=294128 RepID=A0A8B7N790_HYAAZ|nr:serine-rich adhesin for platelets isoform X1 [Hyalella azteca]XP_018009758.1 serine-rich adhesin for platelets isoform X2 [Hyalella azteca]
MMFSVRGGSYYSALIEPRDDSAQPATKGGLDTSLYSGKDVLCGQALDLNRKDSLITPTTTSTTNTTTSTHIISTTTTSGGSLHNNSGSNNLLNNNNQLNSDHHSGGGGSSTPGLRFQSTSLDSSNSSSGGRSLLCTSSGSSHKSSSSSPLSLNSIKAAWKSLTSITSSSSSSSKLPHLERQSDSGHSPGSSGSGGQQASGHSSQQDYRYTQVPTSSASALHILANKRHKDNSSSSSQHQSLHNTHIYLTPASRSYTHPHRSPLQPAPTSHIHHNHGHHQHLPGSSHHISSSFRATLSSHTSRSSNFSGSSVSRATGEALTLAKCLRKHREKQQKIHEQALTRKSKSDNALQKIGVNLKSQSDQNLHKVWLVGTGGSQASCCVTNNSIFSTVQLSGGSGDSTASVASSSNSNSSYRKKRRKLLGTIGIEEEIRRREEQEEREERSRSLERHHGQRISSSSSSSGSRRHTRSLERNHKFRVDLRHLIPSPPLCPHLEPIPPDHQAPSPPTHTAPFIPHSSSTSGSSSCSQQSFSPCIASPSLGSYPSSSGGSNTYSPTPHDTLAVGHSRLACLTATAGNLLSNSWCSSSSGSSSSGASSCGVEGKITMEAGATGGSFINKPARGWLHTDTQLADGSITYAVRYIGCLEVNTSMKSLNFDTRSLIAKECISRVCEAAGLKTADRRRKTTKTIGRILGESPLMQHAGSNVTLAITSAALKLALLDTGALIAHHDMPNISFASGGDPDTLDFIAYVAKDCRYGRACFVLECGGGQAQNVITSIGQAFELRFKEYLKKTPQTQAGVTAGVGALTSNASNVPGANGSIQNLNHNVQAQPGVSYTTVSKDRLPGNARNDDPEYYNDLPGKVPPDIIPPSGQPPPVPPLPSLSTAPLKVNNGCGGVQAALAAEDKFCNNNRSSDLTAGPPAGDAPRPPSAAGVGNLIDLSNGGLEGSVAQEPEYVNDAVIKQSQQAAADKTTIAKDPFDMQPFSATLSHLDATTPKSLSLQQRLQLAQELWYHGPINRKQAEDLLKQDGDFLVRESQGTAGQFVLTGMQNSVKKHLLLVDPNGVVRTKCQTFSSVSHLINYHRDNELPIVSAESALVLRNPVIRRTTPPNPR